MFKLTSAQWSSIYTSSSNSFYGACRSIGTDTCFVADESGKIYRTIDGGANWTSFQTIFNFSWIKDIDFPSPSIGYACGGTAFGMYKSCVAKTTDGGTTWDSINANQFGFDFYQMQFLNDSVGYLVGDRIVKTTDAGNTFTDISIPGSGNTTALHFFDMNNGFVSTRKYINIPWSNKFVIRIFHTTNGGSTWLMSYIDTVEDYSSINDLKFKDALNGIAIGGNGYYLRTTDGGANWIKYNTFNDSIQLNEITYIKGTNTAYMVGSYNTNAVVYKSVDGGVNWQLNYTLNASGFLSITMPTIDIGYLLSGREIFKTTNGGFNAIVDESDVLSDVKLFPNPSNGYITVTKNDPTSTYKLYILSSTGELVYQDVINATKKDLNLNVVNGFYQVFIIDSKNNRKKIIPILKSE